MHPRTKLDKMYTRTFLFLHNFSSSLSSPLLIQDEFSEILFEFAQKHDVVAQLMRWAVQKEVEGTSKCLLRFVFVSFR